MFIKRYHKEVRGNKFQAREIFAVHIVNKRFIFHDIKISYKWKNTKNPIEETHKRFLKIQGDTLMVN